MHPCSLFIEIASVFVILFETRDYFSFLTNFSRRQIDDIHLIFPRKEVWYFMQIVSYLEILHEMSEYIFQGKIRKIVQNVVC